MDRSVRKEIVEDAIQKNFGGRPGKLKRHGEFEYRWRAGPLWDHEERAFTHRDLVLIVERAFEPVATMSVTQFRMMDECDNESFQDYADSVSQTAYDFASNVLSVFDEDVGPLEYSDSILLIKSLHIQQGTPSGVWPAIREAILEKFKSSCDFVAFKAFPLEFENHSVNPRSPQQKSALDRRRNAMYRHYAKNLGGTPIGDEGWMLSHTGLDLEPNPSWANLTTGCITFDNHPTKFATQRGWTSNPSQVTWSPESGVVLADEIQVEQKPGDRTEADDLGDEYQPRIDSNRLALARLLGRSGHRP